MDNMNLDANTILTRYLVRCYINPPYPYSNDMRDCCLIMVVEQTTNGQMKKYIQISDPFNPVDYHQPSTERKPTKYSQEL